MITGAAGFIGSAAARHFAVKYPDYEIILYDSLTYAGNIENVRDVLSSRVTFVYGDIRNFNEVLDVMRKYSITKIIHFAAESHVDRSIKDPGNFVTTNVNGTETLLRAALTAWKETSDSFNGKLFYHVSTDEVYGDLELEEPRFTENNKYYPHSPYSASKAASDHFVRAYHSTFGLPVIISNCSNNYGPRQFPEKLIPLAITRLMDSEPIPVYGTGLNVRDWLYVEDHVSAIDYIMHFGNIGETYNIGGNNERANLQVLNTLVKEYEHVTGNKIPADPLEFVADRPGHDRRYAIDSSKLKKLGWEPQWTFEDGMRETVRWYADNTEWIKNITSGEYLKKNALWKNG